MNARHLLTAAALILIGGAASAAMAQVVPAPQYNQLGAARAAGEDPTYHVNRYGFGNYVQGPNGAYGGYPAGSAGAIELEKRHEEKCRFVPERC